MIAHLTNHPSSQAKLAFHFVLRALIDSSHNGQDRERGTGGPIVNTCGYEHPFTQSPPLLGSTSLITRAQIRWQVNSLTQSRKITTKEKTIATLSATRMKRILESCGNRLYRGSTVSGRWENDQLVQINFNWFDFGCWSSSSIVAESVIGKVQEPLVLVWFVVVVRLGSMGTTRATAAVCQLQSM